MEKSTSLPVRVAVLEERTDAMDEAVKSLTATVSKGIWALVGFAFTVAGSAVLIAITIASSGTP